MTSPHFPGPDGSPTPPPPPFAGTDDEGNMILSMSQMGKQRFPEGKGVSQGYAAQRGKSGELEPQADFLKTWEVGSLTTTLAWFPALLPLKDNHVHTHMGF